MRSNMLGWAWCLSLLLLPALQATAQQQTVDLRPLLQGELSEIAMLTAQSNHLRQHNDPQAAALIASYIPDHQAQAARLSSVITAAGGDPSTVHPERNKPVLGSFRKIIAFDMRQHQLVYAKYQALFQQCTTPLTQQLAILGMNGASRHFSSLTVARAAVVRSPANTVEGMTAALTLERGIVADLQVQATGLQALGDATTANALLATVAAHQQQVTNLTALVTQLGGDPTRAVPPPTIALSARADILARQQIIATQMIDSYAFPIQAFPNTTVQALSQQGQTLEQQTLAQLGLAPLA